MLCKQKSALQSIRQRTLFFFCLCLPLIALAVGFPAGNHAFAQAAESHPSNVISTHHTPANLPSGCVNDGNVDYPGAINCILAPTEILDCNVPTSPANCNYTSSDRPTSCTVIYSPTNTVITQPCKMDEVVIHDTEGSLASALSVFQCPVTDPNCGAASIHYIVDTDGTVYQVLREKDIAYHAGNFWVNMHSIGIEHVGYDATGYDWYNTAQYLSSAKLVAYLLQKYHMPLDHSHVVSHGMVPSPSLAASPNHVDPGPYWLWDYYFQLISWQGVHINAATPVGTITLHPLSSRAPAGPGGKESATKNFNFFYLYEGPSTASARIAHDASSTDITEVLDNVEVGVPYAFTRKVRDSAGSGATMYEIWFGEQKHTPTDYTANAKRFWLAVPPGAGVEGQGHATGARVVTLADAHSNDVAIYGRPTSNSANVIGYAPSGAVFASSFTVTEDGTETLWYEINFNHRQAWVPASAVTI
jgi:N-acetyl-anhydromuramyl-L-alanine amidase AmpD